jgi:hypothetical protein
MQPGTDPVPQGTENAQGANGDQTQQTPPTDALSDAPKAPENQPAGDNAAELERLKAERDALQKERDQARMRENQLKNEREAEERKRLEEQGEWEKIARDAQAKLEEREREENERTIRQENQRLRDGVIENYPNPVVKQAAQKLIDKNENALYWGTATDEVDAQAQVKAQLDAMAEVLGTTPAPENTNTNTPPVDGNNPLPPSQQTPESAETPQQVIDRLGKKLEGVTF